MIAASPTLKKPKEFSLAVFQENETYLEKILYHQLLNVIRRAHAKFAALDFINKGIILKHSKQYIPFDISNNVPDCRSAWPGQTLRNLGNLGK